MDKRSVVKMKQSEKFEWVHPYLLSFFMCSIKIYVHVLFLNNSFSDSILMLYETYKSVIIGTLNLQKWLWTNIQTIWSKS